ncbi:MAG: FGGY-family carbohydrate kinase, partial [Pseudomonadota bacterium]|nr:FGGY-family carbohydrate kinase [Pseudomonadota bacterium]
MTPDLLLAIDVGTQSVRSLAFDRDGAMHGRAQVMFEPPFDSPQPGWAEKDAASYWQALVESCQALWQQGDVRPERIAALTLTAQRGTVVCAREDGTPLRPAIVWPDQRLCSAPPPLGAFWSTLFGVAGAGLLVRQLQRQAEANWLAQHEGALWKRCERFTLLSGWLAHRLVGEWVDSAACQVGYLPFDYKRQQWARDGDWQWKALAIGRGQLPRLVPAAARLGTLTDAAAAALGLPRALSVIAAAADKACEVLGCGVLEPDAAHLSFGTAATINTTQAKYMEVQRLLPAYPAAWPGAFNTEIQIQRGFWLVSWFKTEFAHEERARAAERGVSAESLFDELIASVPPGSMGLMLQPYWSPGLRDPGPEGKGAIIGFGDVHTRAHLYRAMIEGLAYGLRAGGELIEARTRRPIRRLVISGGGAQSDGAMQIAADVFALAAERPQLADASSLGAAMLAATGLGWHADVPAAVAAMA